MKLCELVRGYKTSDEAMARAREFAEGVGKTVVVVNRDVAGFVTTRLITALAMEAIALVESGVASAEDVDTACRLGFGHAMGPLETADMTGVDIIFNATSNIYADSQDEKFSPPEMLRRMVTAGDLGRKIGQGLLRLLVMLPPRRCRLRHAHALGVVAAIHSQGLPETRSGSSASWLPCPPSPCSSRTSGRAYWPSA